MKVRVTAQLAAELDPELAAILMVRLAAALCAALTLAFCPALAPAFYSVPKSDLSPWLTAASYSALNSVVNPGVTPLLPARVSGTALGYEVAPGQAQYISVISASVGR